MPTWNLGEGSIRLNIVLAPWGFFSPIAPTLQMLMLSDFFFQRRNLSDRMVFLSNFKNNIDHRIKISHINESMESKNSKMKEKNLQKIWKCIEIPMNIYNTISIFF